MQESVCPHCDQTLKIDEYYTETCLRIAGGESAPIDGTGIPLKEETWESSAKIDKLMDLLDDIRSRKEPGDDPMETDSKEKVLVFSQWTTMLDLIEIPLELHGYCFRRLDGQMSLSARSRVMEEFRADPEIMILLVSLRAASLGVNLTCANHVILMDLWWNPAVEEQAIDRAHRIGQTRNVSVTRITVKDTVDERILALQKRKLALIRNVVHSQQHVHVSGKLTIEDIHFLFDLEQ